MPVQFYNPDGTPVPKKELEDRVFILNPTDRPHYSDTVRVRITTDPDVPAKSVTVTGELDSSVTPVLIVDSDESSEEYIRVNNPDSLPFWVEEYFKMYHIRWK